MIKIDGHVFINESKNITQTNGSIIGIFTGNSICTNCGYTFPYTIDYIIYNILLDNRYLTCKNFIIKKLLE